MENKNRDKNHVKSIDKALDILLLFNRQERELSHAEIARRLGWSTSTVSRFLGTLLERDFLKKNEENGKYSLGNMIFYLGSVVRSNLDIRDHALPVMEEIHRRTDETVQMFIRDGINRICIEQVESTQVIRMFCEIGLRDVLWIGTTGRVLIAWSSPETRQELYRRIRAEAPEVDTEKMEQMVRQARADGYAITDPAWDRVREKDRHCACISAPIFNQNGKVKAALALSVPDFRLPDNTSEYIRMVMEGARTISLSLGWYD